MTKKKEETDYYIMTFAFFLSCVSGLSGISFLVSGWNTNLAWFSIPCFIMTIFGVFTVIKERRKTH